MKEIVGPVESLHAFVGVIHYRHYITLVDVPVKDETSFVEFLHVDALFALEAESSAATANLQVSVFILRLEDADGIDESTAHHAIGEVSHIELARLDLRMRALFIEMTSQFLRLFVEARRILEDLGCHAMHHIILQSAVVIKVEELPYIECVKEEVRHGVTQLLAERHVRLSEMHALFGSLVADNM